MYEMLPIAGGTITALVVARWLTKLGFVATVAKVISGLIILFVIGNVVGVISVDVQVERLVEIASFVWEVVR